MQSFTAHLNRCSAIVATWPEWKQRLLGGRVMSDETDCPGDIIPLVEELKQIGGDGWTLPRHGCGPGAALPADTVTEGASLPRRTYFDLLLEFQTLCDAKPPCHWDGRQLYYQRLADLAGQIAGQIAGLSE